MPGTLHDVQLRVWNAHLKDVSVRYWYKDIAVPVNYQRRRFDIRQAVEAVESLHGSHLPHRRFDGSRVDRTEPQPLFQHIAMQLDKFRRGDGRPGTAYLILSRQPFLRRK